MRTPKIDAWDYLKTEQFGPVDHDFYSPASNRFQWIPLHELAVLPEDENEQRALQRKFNTEHRNHLYRFFRPELVNSLTVAVITDARGHRYYVIDGQHRFAVLQTLHQMHPDHYTHAHCVLIACTSLGHAARYAIALNKNRKAQNSMDTAYRLPLLFEHPYAVAMHTLGEELGLNVASYTDGPDRVKCHATLRRIWDRTPEPQRLTVLRRLLATAQATHPGHPKAFSQRWLMGLAFFLHQNPRITTELFADVMRDTSPVTIIQDTKVVSGGNGGYEYAKHLAEVFIVQAKRKGITHDPIIVHPAR